MEDQPLPGTIETPENLSRIIDGAELQKLQNAENLVLKLTEELSLAKATLENNEEHVLKLEEELSLAKIALEKAEKSALTDPLTGLVNRRGFFRAADKLIAEFNRDSHEKKNEYAIMMLDIDHFKKINDTYGHDVGDIVLKKAAEVLLSIFRGTDTVARYGGEEFCILIENTNIEEIKNRLKEGRQDSNPGISFSIEINNETIFVNFSGGIVPLIPKDINDILQATAHADTLLYLAKNEGGRNCIKEGKAELAA